MKRRHALAAGNVGFGSGEMCVRKSMGFYFLFFFPFKVDDCEYGWDFSVRAGGWVSEGGMGDELWLELSYNTYNRGLECGMLWVGWYSPSCGGGGS